MSIAQTEVLLGIILFIIGCFEGTEEYRVSGKRKIQVSSAAENGQLEWILLICVFAGVRTLVGISSDPYTVDRVSWFILYFDCVA